MKLRGTAFLIGAEQLVPCTWHRIQLNPFRAFNLFGVTPQPDFRCTRGATLEPRPEELGVPRLFSRPRVLNNNSFPTRSRCSAPPFTAMSTPTGHSLAWDGQSWGVGIRALLQPPAPLQSRLILYSSPAPLRPMQSPSDGNRLSAMIWRSRDINGAVVLRPLMVTIRCGVRSQPVRGA